MEWNSPQAKRLLQAFLSLQNATEAKRFLRDLMTESELEEFAKRLDTARLLTEKASYPAIQKATGFSTTTIARVSKWLQTGMGGYALVLPRLHHTSVSGGRGVR